MTSNRATVDLRRRILATVFFLVPWILLSACQPVSDEASPVVGSRTPATAPMPSATSRELEGIAEPATERMVYVAVYSHIYHQGGRTLPLEATLSIRNTDPDRPIVIRSVRYYDTSGAMIQEYLDEPATLDPLASSDFLVERRDMAGGAGANFMVEWAAPESVNEPIIETVMVGSEGNRAFAFARPGRAVERHP